MEKKISKHKDVVPLWLVLLICLGILELAGQSFAKQFAVSGAIEYSLLAIFFILSANLCLQHMLRQGLPLGVAGILFGVTIALGMLLIGTLLFGESLTTAKLIGACFGFAALILLAL